MWSAAVCGAFPFASGDGVSKGKFSIVAAFSDHFASPVEGYGEAK